MLDLLGFGLVIPLLSFYAEEFQATAVQVTMLMACYSLAQFLFAPAWGALSDRVGRRPVMLISVAASAIFLAGFAAATELWMLFLFRTLHGAAAANISTAQAYVADVTTPEDRARGMGLIGASFGLGFTLGPVVGGLLAPYGLSAPIWLAAFLSAINFVWAYAKLPESKVEGKETTTHKRTLSPALWLAALKHPIVGMAISLTFIATFCFSMMESTFGLVAEHVWGLGAREVGLVFGLIGIITIVIQGGMIRKLSARFGESKLVMAGYLLNGTGMALLALANPAALWIADGLAAMLAGAVCLAAGSSLANPSLSSLISRATPANEQGWVLGVNQSLAAMSRAVAPTIGGLLYTGIYPGAAFAAGAFLMTGALAVSIPATRRASA